MQNHFTGWGYLNVKFSVTALAGGIQMFKSVSLHCNYGRTKNVIIYPLNLIDEISSH